MKPAVQTQVKIAFEPADLSGTRYDGWIADRMGINVEKRLLTLDLDMILDPFVNRPGQAMVGRGARGKVPARGDLRVAIHGG